MGLVRKGLAPALRLVTSSSTSEPRELRPTPRPELRPTPRPELRPTPRPALDDSEILAGVRAGDASTAAALHDRARPIVVQTLMRMLGPSDCDLDDVTQRSLLEVARSLGRFRADCSLDTWIARVTAHTAYKQLRRRQLERRIFSGEELSDAHESPVDLERQSLHREGLERVRAHLGEMDADRAWTLVLHDVCGHDLREIAEITGASVAAAQSRLVRARRELHARLAADPELANVLSRGGG